MSNQDIFELDTIRTSKNLKQSLARRLLIYVLIIMLLTATFAGLIQTYASFKLEQQNRDTSIRYAIETIVPILESSLWSYELHEVETEANALLKNPYISGVLITDDLGKTVTFRGDAFEMTSLPTVDSIQVMSMKNNTIFENLIYQSRIYHSDPYQKSLVGHLFITAPGELIFSRISSIVKVIILTLFIMLMLLTFFFYIIQQKIVALPLKTLTNNIKSLNPLLNNVSYAPEINQLLMGRNDEIGELFNTFSQMRNSIIARDQQLQEQQKSLEDTVERRTTQLKQSNEHLERSLEQLRIAQDELIETEKMAALGGLVSGVAHEVNTPLGIGITATSHLTEELKLLKQAFKNNEITVTKLDDFLHESQDTLEIILNNLQRAASLIHSFKQVAVDQSSEEIRKINLNDYIEEVLRSLYPRFKKTEITIETHLDKDININLYPGALAQVITNLLMNAFIHAFDNGTNPGLIKIYLSKEYDYLQLIVSDNGKGMSNITLNKIFEPFFTTQRGSGGSGLGMNIVYNLITHKLRGKIYCTSEEHKGSEFVILLPIEGIQLEQSSV